MNTLEEITQLLKNNNLSLDNIKCFDIYFWDGTELVDYGPGGTHEEAKYSNISLRTYEDSKPAMYDDHREAMFEDIAEIASIEGFGTVWLNNGDWLSRQQPHWEEVYPAGWGYETVPQIPESLIVNSQGN